MEDENNNSKESDINSSPLNPVGKIQRTAVTHSQNKMNHLQNQKLEQIKSYLQKKTHIVKDIIVEKDDDRLKNIFKDYEVWSDLNDAFRQPKDRENFKLFRHPHRVYFGQMKHNKKSGRGISVYEDGKLYEGYCLQNEKHGQGFELYTNGNVYNGSFEHNKKHGKGQMYWFNLKGDNNMQQYYIGQWWGGLPFGQGRHQRANGDIYQGTFRNGLKHGKGEEFFANGDHYKGQYVNGLPEGKGQYLWSNGASYNGQFQQGVRSGFGRWKKQDSKNTQSYQGTFLMDLKSGQGVYTWPEGKFYKGQFMNDKRHGFGEMYEGESLILRCFWQNGKAIKNNTETEASLVNPERSLIKQEYSMIYPRPKSQSRLLTSNMISAQKPQKTTKLLGPISKPYKSHNNYDSVNSIKRPKNRMQTEVSTNMPSIKELSRLSRPSSLIKLDLKTNRESFKKLATECDQNLCGRKFGHKCCIPQFPWEKRGQRVLDKL